MPAYPQFITGISVQYQGGASFQQFQRDLGVAQGAAERATQGIARGSRQLNEYSERWRALGLAAQTAQGPFSSLGTRFNAISRSLDELGNKLGGALAALAGGGALVAATASFQNYSALLKSTTQDEQEFQAALGQTFEIANRSRTSLEGTIRLYARLKPSLEQAGVGFDQLGQIVETANKSITLSGAGAQEATAAMIQFSQALSLGRLSGDEFRSLGENAGFLLRTIREGIARGGLVDGFDGSQGALRKLAEDQKLTTDLIVEALRIMEGEVNARFERMPVTISQGATRIQNSVLQMVATLEQSTGALSAVGKGMVLFADNLDVVVALAAPLVARFIGIDKVVLALAGSLRVAGNAIGLFGVAALTQVRAMQALGISTEVVRANATRLAAAQAAGSAVAIRYAQAQNVAAAAGSALATAGRGLLAILGGPLGAAITAVTVGLTYMALQKNAVAKAADLMGTSEEALRQKIEENSKSIAVQNGLLAENAKLKREQTLSDAGSLLSSTRNLAGYELDRIVGQANPRNRIDVKKLRELGQAVRGGFLDPRFFEQELKAAGVTPESIGAGQYGRLAETLTAVQAAQLAEQKAAGDLFGSERQRGGRKRSPGLLGAQGPSDASVNASRLISDAKRAATATDAATEKARIRAAAEQELGRISRDVTLSDQQKAEQAENVWRGYLQQASAIDERAKAEREAGKASRAAAAQAKADAREASQLAEQQRRLADAAREAAEGWAAQTEAQRIAERQGDALARVQKALEAGAIDPLTAGVYRAGINKGAQEALDRPFEEAIKASEAELAVLNAILDGRESEAAFLSRKAQLEENGKKLSEDQQKVLRDTIDLERQRNRELDARNRLVDIYANAAGQVQGAGRNAIRRALDSDLNPTTLINDLLSGFKDTIADSLSNALFGDQEAEARRQMTDATNRNVQALEENTAALRGESVGGVAPAASGVAQAAQGIGGLLGGRVGGLLTGLGTVIAKPLEAIGIRTERSQREQTDALKKTTSSLPANPEEAYNRIGDSIGKALGINGLGGKLGTALQGAGTGALVAGVGNTLGLGLSTTGASAGGAIGSLLGIPGGDIIGSIAGGLLGKLFSSAKKGSVTITGAGGQIVQGSATGNSATRREAAEGFASDFSEALQNIADRLGTSIGNFAVSIGQRDDKISVDPTGRGNVSKKYGAVQFDDVQSAIAFALSDAINDGALKGIRASTSRLLEAGKNLQSQLDKALRFEDVFKRLRSYTDPVGLAVDELNREFESLRRVFDEAGASAEEYAQLQQLYDLEREQTIIESQSRITQSLKQLLDDLLVGDNGLSLRDRQANAQAEFGKFSSDAAIKADPDGFAEAARNLLDIERQLFGSQTQYFDRFNQIVETAQRVLGSESSVLPPAFSVGERLDVKPITDGLGVVGDTIVGAIGDLGDRIAAIFASNGGGTAALGFQPRVAAF